MGRKLSFKKGGTEYIAEMDKLKRDALYGWSEIEVRDLDGNECKLVSVADDGKTLFDKGGYAFANLSSAGKFVESDELIPVNPENNEPLEDFESSFASGVELKNEVDADVLLSYQVKSVYQLDFDKKAEVAVGDKKYDEVEKNIKEAAALIAELKKGTIYQFPFSYRDGINQDVGFLLTNIEGEPFMFLTTPSEIEYLGFEHSIQIEDEEVEDEDDGLDFGSL